MNTVTIHTKDGQYIDRFIPVFHTIKSLKALIRHKHNGRGIVEVNRYKGDEVRTFRVNTGRATT